MWELAYRRGYFDRIEINKLDDDQYDMVQNFIAHRDMPFGLGMPHGRDIFPDIDNTESLGETLRQNVLTLETWGENVRHDFNVEEQYDPECWAWNLKLKRVFDQRASFSHMQHAMESNSEDAMVCMHREEFKKDEQLINEKVFVLERAIPAKEVMVEYVRTKKERYIRVSEIKYKWHGGSQEYRCANRACKGRVMLKDQKYYQVIECKHKTK